MDYRLRVITEDGEEAILVSEYNRRPELHKMFGLITVPPPGRATVFAGTTIVSMPIDLLLHDKKRGDLFNELQNMVEQNPLAYFLPQAGWALDFLNDTEHNLKGLVAPNGVGKTVLGWVDAMLDIIECDKNWPIFKDHGVKMREYRGPYPDDGAGIVTYKWDHHQATIWPLIKQWSPKSALPYRGGGIQSPNWKSSPKTYIAGSMIKFHACSQDDDLFESAPKRLYWWDEQGEEQKFNGAQERARRRHGRHTMTLTPHKIRGRPDTGANNWIHQLYRGDVSFGLRVKFHQGSLVDVPDWIYSEREKNNAIENWINEPIRTGNTAKLREGRARVYGEFHETGGLVFDEFDKNTHILHGFRPPDSWTRYRFIDHGRVEPCAAIAVAASPDGDLVIYDEYYEKDKLASRNAIDIIKWCGNDRQEIGSMNINGRIFKRYREVFRSARFRWTHLDSRSFSKKSDDSELQIGQIYRYAGLAVQPADGNDSYTQIPICKEYLEIDPDRRHLGTGKLGAPIVYVTDNCRWFLWEIAQYMNEPTIRTVRGERVASERPRARDDHLMAAFRFMCMARPIYVPGFSDLSKERQESEVVRKKGGLDPITGWYS